MLGPSLACTWISGPLTIYKILANQIILIMYKFLLRPLDSFIGCCVVCLVNESSKWVFDCVMCSVFHWAMKQKYFNMNMKLEVVFMWSWYGLWKRKIEWIIFWVLFIMLKKTEYIQLFSIVEGSWQKQMCSTLKRIFWIHTTWMIFFHEKIWCHTV